MNKHLKNYLNSFKLKKEHGYSLLIDVLFLGIIVSAFVFFGNLMKKQSFLLSQGKTSEQLQQMLLSMQPEQLNVFLSSLKSFVLVFVVGIIVILVGGLLLYSLSRKLIWGYLTEKIFYKRKYWKWNLINLVLIIPLVIYLFVFGLVKLILNYLVALFRSQLALNIINSLINLFFLFVLIIFVFLVYYSFVRKYKVWESMGEAFNLIRLKWKKLWPMFLLVLGTAIVLSLILWPLRRLFVYQPNILLGINLVVSLLFLAWMRIYVFRAVRE